MTDTEIAAIIIVVCLVVMDWLTGLAKAIKNKDISSEKLREGLWHKSAYVLLIILAEIIEHAQAWMDLGFALPIVIPACTYIALTETASIIENIGQLNPDLNSSRLLQLFRSTAADTTTEWPKHKAADR